MSYVIYVKNTTKLLTRRTFKTESAAKAGLTRELKKLFPETDIKATNVRDNYAIAESDIFYRVIEKKVPVENMMSGKIVYEGVNTPNYMSVGSEAYWSM